MSGSARKRKMKRHGSVQALIDESRITPYMSPYKKRREAAGANAVGVKWTEWSPQNVADHVRDQGFNASVSRAFEEQSIWGNQLPQLTEQHLKEWGIVTGDRLRLLKLFRDITKPGVCSAKVFNDSVHGHIELDRVLVKIIDTPQFQRLRDIKQLGATYFVFPGGGHNRFEHSLGVCHLAGCLVESIRERQPDLGITNVDVLCCKMAGLCHDLGHGPFSHMFDGSFIPMVSPESNWKHEMASADMFDHLIKENGLAKSLELAGVGEQDLKFVKEMIAGPIFKDEAVDDDWPYIGRSIEKSFLYEVVANKRNGIDVDKWDYCARDCHNLGISVMFDYRRFLKFARVIRVDHSLQICTRDKEVGNLYDLFHTRNALHRRAYQHKTSNIIEQMICEALVKANDFIFLSGRDGKRVKMSDAIYDMHAYTMLTDSIFYRILASDDKDLAESRDLLRAIQRRELYRSVAQTNVSREQPYKASDAQQIAEEIVKAVPESYLEMRDLPSLSSDEVCVHVVNFSYGMKEKNPIDNVRFYQKDHPNKASRVKKDQVSLMLPENFSEQNVRLYLKDREDQDKHRTANWCFQQWCQVMGYPAPKDGSITDLELTPMKCSQDQSESLPSSQDQSLLSNQTPTFPDYKPAASGHTPIPANVAAKLFS